MAAAAIPVLTKAAPWIASGVGALFGKKSSGASKGQQAAMASTQQSQNQLGAAAAPMLQQGSGLAQQGSGYLGQAGKYYGDILGSRQSARESLAPEMTTALDFYKGAENKAKRTLTGGSRDYATAELDRQKVGQIAGMLPAARRSAAEGITGVGSAALSGGSQMSGTGAGLLDTSARIGAGQFDQATKIREQEQAGGKSWGSTIFDIIKGGVGGGGGKGGKSPLASTSFAPGLLMGGPGKMGG